VILYLTHFNDEDHLIVDVIIYNIIKFISKILILVNSIIILLNKWTNGSAIGALGFIFAILGWFGEMYQVICLTKSGYFIGG